MTKKSHNTKHYYIKTHDNGDVKQKCFRVREALYNYFKETIDIEKRRSEIGQLDDSSYKEFHESDKKNDRMKSYVLDDIIFPAMANLTFFFTTIADNYKLRLLFEDDIKELLGVKRNNPTSINNGFMFDNLISAILVWGLNARNQNYDSEKDREKDNNKKNFRIHLLHLVQLMVERNMQFLNGHYLPYTMYSYDLISQDLRRALAWTSLLAANADEEYYLGVDPNRYEELSSKSEAELTKEDVKYLASNKVAYSKYIEMLIANRPGRTFECD